MSVSALAEEKAAAAAAAVVGEGTLEEKAAAAAAAEAAVEKAAALRAKDHKSLLSSTKDLYFQVRVCPACLSPRLTSARDAALHPPRRLALTPLSLSPPRTQTFCGFHSAAPQCQRARSVTLQDYRYISCESFSRFDSLPLTYLIPVARKDRWSSGKSSASGAAAGGAAGAWAQPLRKGDWAVFTAVPSTRDAGKFSLVLCTVTHFVRFLLTI